MFWIIVIGIICLVYPAVGLPILGVSIVMAVLIYISGAPERKRQAKIEKDFAVIDNMSGQQFEYYVAQLLQKNGYTDIQLTKTSGDYGVDIIANYDGVRCAVQCKRYSKKLGLKPIQEVRTGMIHYGAQIAMVVTNNYFTKNAITLANETDVILLDRGSLNYMLTKIAKAEEQEETKKMQEKERKAYEKECRKVRRRNKIRGLFNRKIEQKDLGYVETPVETCELSDEFLELKEQAEEFMGKKN